MDYNYPMCALQAFAVALSSFDGKLACEWLYSQVSQFKIMQKNKMLIPIFKITHTHYKGKKCYVIGFKLVGKRCGPVKDQDRFNHFMAWMTEAPLWCTVCSPKHYHSQLFKQCALYAKAFRERKYLALSIIFTSDPEIFCCLGWLASLSVVLGW